MTMIRYSVAAVMLGMLSVFTGCTISPDPDPVVIEEPIDAFNAVGRPYVPRDNSYGSTLSSEIQRLQNARRLYELSRERQLNAVQHRQRQCRQQSDSRRVPVQGTPGDFVYCQPVLNTREASD